MDKIRKVRGLDNVRLSDNKLSVTYKSAVNMYINILGKTIFNSYVFARSDGSTVRLKLSRNAFSTQELRGNVMYFSKGRVNEFVRINVDFKESEIVGGDKALILFCRFGMPFPLVDIFPTLGYTVLNFPIRWRSEVAQKFKTDFRNFNEFIGALQHKDVFFSRIFHINDANNYNISLFLNPVR